MAETEASPDSLVHVVDPYGNLGTIDQTEARDALTNGGFRLATSDEVKNLANAKKYGDGFSNSLKAMAAGAARSATFGASDVGLAKSGAVDPETLNQLKERHPLANTIGEIGGIAGALLTGGSSEAAGAAGAATEGAGMLSRLANPVKAVSELGHKAGTLIATPEAGSIASRIARQAASAGLGSAVEGSVYGLGQSVSEYGLGDPDLNGQKIMANMGYGALLGGGLGAAIGGTLRGIGEMRGFAPHVEETALRAQIHSDAMNAGLPDQPVGPIQSFQDVADRVKNADLPAISDEAGALPAKERLLEINAALGDSNPEFNPDGPFPLPAHNIQIQSLNSPYVRDMYKTFLESGSEDAQNLQKFESGQKSSAVKWLNNSIRQLSPEGAVITDVSKAGQDLVDHFKTQYEAEKKEIAPLFKKIDDAAVNSVSNTQDIVDRLEQSFPEVSKYLTRTEDGLKLQPYEDTMGIGDKTYSQINKLVKAVNKPDLTIGELRNLRENMRDSIDWLGSRKSAGEITQLRKSLMDYIEDQVQKVEPDLKVRDAFKRYAVNEGNREVIESMIGGKLDNKAGFAKTINPEDVLKGVFSDTASVNAAKQILGQKEFDKALANYLAVQAKSATDVARNGFSSAKFATFLKGKQPELMAAFAEKPHVLNRLGALTDFMRILPDSPSVNPSGTAKTLNYLTGLQKLSSLLNPRDAAHKAIEGMAKKSEQVHLKLQLEAILRGESVEGPQAQMAKHTVLGWAERAMQKTSQAVKQGTKRIFQTGQKLSEPFSAYIGEKSTPQEKHKKHQQLLKQIHALNNDPEQLIDKLNDSTKSLYASAPQMTGSIQQALVSATQFLASKAPQGPDPKPLSKPFTPSNAELAQFNRYQQIVENPTHILDQVRTATLTPEAVETLQTVYPKLLDEMRTSVIDHLTDHLSKEKEIPYRVRMSLSMFLGQDLDHTLDQQSIAANQMTMASLGHEQATQEAQQHVKASQKGLSKVNSAHRMMTAFQSNAQRENA